MEEKEKTRRQTPANNFTKYQPIVKLFSLTDSVVNLQLLVFEYPTTPLKCRYTTLWNMNVRKRRQSEICIVINDKSCGSITKHLRSDAFVYYTFITKSAGERIFKIGEHLAKFQAKR